MLLHRWAKSTHLAKLPQCQYLDLDILCHLECPEHKCLSLNLNIVYFMEAPYQRRAGSTHVCGQEHVFEKTPLEQRRSYRPGPPAVYP